MQGTHVPVLLDRVLALLAPAVLDGPAVVVDATVGLGGHAEALLAAHPSLTLVGLDRDPSALALSAERLRPYAERLHLLHAVYDELPSVLDGLGLPGVDGVLFDLGVSSMQLDSAARGFAATSSSVGASPRASSRSSGPAPGSRTGSPTGVVSRDRAASSRLTSRSSSDW